MKKKSSKIEIPEEWSKFFLTVSRKSFQDKVLELEKITDHSDRLEIFKSLYNEFVPDTKFGKLDICYKNDWRIDILAETLLKMNGLFNDKTEDDEGKMVYSRTLFLHLDIFFTDMKIKK